MSQSNKNYIKSSWCTWACLSGHWDTGIVDVICIPFTSWQADLYCPQITAQALWCIVQRALGFSTWLLMTHCQLLYHQHYRADCVWPPTTSFCVDLSNHGHLEKGGVVERGGARGETEANKCHCSWVCLSEVWVITTVTISTMATYKLIRSD